MKAIAIDDEPIALEVIKALAKKVPFISLEATFVNALEAIVYLKKHPVDLVFLDINMPDITGLDVAQLLPPSCSVVFTTAYSQYAVDAFNINALDYLIKPIELSRFLKACQKAVDVHTPQGSVPTTHFFVKEGYDLVRINMADLFYVQSEGNYLTFKESTKKTLARMTMTEVSAQLPAQQFMRVHKSYIINLQHIAKIERHQVWLNDQSVIPISSQYRDELMKFLS